MIDVFGKFNIHMHFVNHDCATMFFSVYKITGRQKHPITGPSTWYRDVKTRFRCSQCLLDFLAEKDHGEGEGKKRKGCDK